MEKFSVDALMTHVSGDTAVVVNCEALNALRRFRVYDITYGTDSTPADAAIRWQCQRFSAAGTTTAVVPQPLDSEGVAADTEAGEVATVEPTYTGVEIVQQISLNQRATYRWVASPGGEILSPAVDEEGLGWLPVLSTGTPGLVVQIYFEE